MTSARGVARAAVAAAVVLLAAGAVQAAITMDTVPVGNTGNTGEGSGQSYGGYGPDRICGAVGYQFNIGKYEVTAGQYTAFLNAVAVTDTYGLYNTLMADPSFGPLGCNIERAGSSGSYSYSVASDWADRPVNYVSFWDACRFANWLHNGQPTGAQGAGTTETGAYTLGGYNGNDGQTIQRNPVWKWAVTSEDEWYKAAYYKGGSTNAGYWDYPTRSNTAPGQDLNDVSGNNANYHGTPYPIQSPYYTTVAGEFQNSASPYGTFDQGGNVWEWNESITYQDATYAYRVIRGGSFYSDSSYLAASFRGGAYPFFVSDDVGFRVVEIPEPATLGLMALGALAAIRRKRT